MEGTLDPQLSLPVSVPVVGNAPWHRIKEAWYAPSELRKLVDVRVYSPGTTFSKMLHTVTSPATPKIHTEDSHLILYHGEI